MIVTFNCPDCGKMFATELSAEVVKKVLNEYGRRQVSEEERKRRSERMKALRASGVGRGSGGRHRVDYEIPEALKNAEGEEG